MPKPKAGSIFSISEVIRQLGKAAAEWETPWVEEDAKRHPSRPFRVLVACLLSLRTQDRTTAAASSRLFSLAETPEALSSLAVETIEKTIYPVGFYRNKARILKNIAEDLVVNYGSRVPDTLDNLLKLKGVGRKTANLVISVGYNKPGICVDTHVHRITNRWGYICTRTPDETETVLRKKLPKRYWKQINSLLVMFGQNCCKPVSPLCSGCRINKYCARAGVTRSR